MEGRAGVRTYLSLSILACIRYLQTARNMPPRLRLAAIVHELHVDNRNEQVDVRNGRSKRC